MDIRQDASITEIYRNPVIYGTGGETSQESSETREITLPRTSYDLLNQDLPPELALADARRCRILKKEIEVACKRIDRNVHFAEQRIRRRGDIASGLARCEEAITEAYKSLLRSAQELTDILMDLDEEVTISVIELMSDTQDCVDSVLITLDDILDPESSGSGDDNTHGPLSLKPRRDNRSDGPPAGRDDCQFLPPSRREGPPPGLVDDCQSLPPSRPGHFQINDDNCDATPSRPNAVPSAPESGGDQIRIKPTRSMDEDNQGFVEVDREMIRDQEKSTELPSPRVYTDKERDTTDQEDHEKEPPAGVDDSWGKQDEVNTVPPADRPKLGSRILIERDCGQDEVDRWSYVRDVKQQESGKELDDLAVLRYLSSKQAATPPICEGATNSVATPSITSRFIASPYELCPPPVMVQLMFWTMNI